MNLPIYISKRYLFAKKKHNAINIVSGISVFGVLVGTLALVVVLSVFNGFDILVKSLYNSFNPDVVVSPVSGKTFIADSAILNQLKNTKGVEGFTSIVENKALLRYHDFQTIATIKGVSNNFTELSEIDNKIINGQFLLQDNNEYRAILGDGIAANLNINLDVREQYRPPIGIYVPKRTGRITINPERALNREYIYPSGIFAIQKEFDSKYVIVPIEFALELFEYSNEITSIEIKLTNYTSVDVLQEEIQNIFGNNFTIKNRYQQNELFYKTMETEKWAIILILSFVIAIFSFTIVESLTMLILEKKEDIEILRSLGAPLRLIKKIFLTEGILITCLGAIIGISLGLLICWLQQAFHIIKLQGSGTFVVDAYPVKIQGFDILLIFLIVMFIGYIAAWYPVRKISKKYILEDEMIYY